MKPKPSKLEDMKKNSCSIILLIENFTNYKFLCTDKEYDTNAIWKHDLVIYSNDGAIYVTLKSYLNNGTKKERSVKMGFNDLAYYLFYSSEFEDEIRESLFN